MKIVHIKDDNSKCSYCGFTITQKYNFKVHNITIHKNVMFPKCNKCDYNSLIEDDLKTHKRTVHNISNVSRLQIHVTGL